MGCTPSATSLAKRPVISVNAEILTTKEFADLIAARLRNLDALSAKNPVVVRQTKELILSDFVNQEIVKQWAKEHQISVTDQDLESEMLVIRKNYPDDIAFRQSLAKEGLDIEAWRNKVKVAVLERRVQAAIVEKIAPPTAQEAESYYKSNADEFSRPSQILVRQVVVEKEEAAQAILKKAEKSKDLGALAKEFSIAPEAKKQGLVGWIPRGVLEVFDQVFNLNKGSFSRVIKSPYGFHVIQVVDKRAETHLKFEDVRDTIMARLRSDRQQALYTRWLEDEIHRARIFRNEELINSVRIETQMN